MNINLDKYQHKAVITSEKNVLVVAAPGSGKTTVIINRIRYLVKEQGINPKTIIVITFTKAAAQNMKKRYIDLTGDKDIPFFGTFHSLFYRILIRHVGEIKIIESFTTYNIIKKVLLKFLDEISDEKINEIINDISALKCSGSNIEEFNSCINKNIFLDCYKAYEEYKDANGLYDFDDLQIKCKKLFLERKDIVQGYQKLFKYILVDEFQDCDDMQLQILQLLNKENSLFAVGDEDQCIYGFRGSKPEAMVHFNELFINGKKLYLSLNYRSTKNIVGMSKELIKYNILRNPKNIEAFRKDEKEIKLSYQINESLQANEISNNIIMLKNKLAYNYSDNAILYRTNKESRSIIDTFIRMKIPFRFLDGKYNFFDHFICKDLLAYLKLCIDSTDKECFNRVINKPFRYISKVNLQKVNASYYKEDCFDILARIKDIPAFQVKTIFSLQRDLNRIAKMTLQSAIDFLIMDIGYIDYLKEYSNKYKVSFTELEEILDEFKASSVSFNKIADFLEHVKGVKEEIENSYKDNNEDSVILSTIHGVKGMEFKNVFIINCVEGFLPHENCIENKSLEEERRLCYVGITRAIDNLYLNIPKTIRGKAKNISRFVKEFNFAQNESLSLAYNKGDSVRHKVFGNGKVIEISSKDIKIEFIDGVTRTFDIIVIENNRLLEKVG